MLDGARKAKESLEFARECHRRANGGVSRRHGIVRALARAIAPLLIPVIDACLRSLGFDPAGGGILKGPEPEGFRPDLPGEVRLPKSSPASSPEAPDSEGLQRRRALFDWRNSTLREVLRAHDQKIEQLALEYGDRTPGVLIAQAGTQLLKAWAEDQFGEDILDSRLVRAGSDACLLAVPSRAWEAFVCAVSELNGSTKKEVKECFRKRIAHVTHEPLGFELYWAGAEERAQKVAGLLGVEVPELIATGRYTPNSSPSPGQTHDEKFWCSDGRWQYVGQALGLEEGPVRIARLHPIRGDVNDS